MRDRYLGQSFSTYEEGKVVPSTSRAAAPKAFDRECRDRCSFEDDKVEARFSSRRSTRSITFPEVGCLCSFAHLVNSIYRPTSTCPFCCLWNRNDTRNRLEKWKYHIDRWPCNELDNDECREINGRVMLFCGLWFCLCVWTFILFFK